MTIRIDVLTIFPEYFTIPSSQLLGKAIKEGIIKVNVHNIRDFAKDRHKTVDDTPYGGVPGMVMKCEPIFEAVESLRGETLSNM
jgi:tRNA (guanine37-N1)-methyltransferase